jgi:hypothetical protein
VCVREREREFIRNDYLHNTMERARNAQVHAQRERVCVCARACTCVSHAQVHACSMRARAFAHAGQHVQCMLDLFFSGSGYGSLSDSNAF